MGQYVAVNLWSCMKAMVRRLASVDFLASSTGGLLGCLGFVWFGYRFNAQWIFGGSKFAAFVAFGIMLTAGSLLARLIVAPIVGWQDAPMAHLYKAYKNGEPASVVVGVAVMDVLFTVLVNTLAVYLIYLVSL